MRYHRLQDTMEVSGKSLKVSSVSRETFATHKHTLEVSVMKNRDR